MSSTKTLIIFDFDLTMVDVESNSTIARLGGYPEEDVKNLYASFFQGLPFIETIGNLYKTLKEKYHKNKKDINEIIHQIKLGKGIPELIEFFKESKNLYDLLVITGNSVYPVKEILSYNKLIDAFDDILGFKSEMKDDGTMIMTPNTESNCDFCGTHPCKYSMLKQYLKEKNLETKYKNMFFICDGFNDFCLGRYLLKEDVLFVKAGQALDKMLKDDKKKNELKCALSYFENGNDIIKYLKNKSQK